MRRSISGPAARFKAREHTGTDMSTETTQADARSCLNCGARVSGRFCGSCGQRLQVSRLSLPHLLGVLPRVVFNLDRGFLSTLLALARRPGRTINAYLDGQRVHFVNPLTLLAALAGLSTLAYSTYPFDFAAGLASLPDGYEAKYAEFQQLSFELYSLSLVLLLPLTAAITWLSFAGSGRVYGEHLAINAYILGFVTLLFLLSFPIFVVVDGTPRGRAVWSWALLPYLGYQAIATYAVFRPRLRAWRCLLGAVLTVVLYVGANFLATGLLLLVYLRA